MVSRNSTICTIFNCLLLKKDWFLSRSCEICRIHTDPLTLQSYTRFCEPRVQLEVCAPGRYNERKLQLPYRERLQNWCFFSIFHHDYQNAGLHQPTTSKTEGDRRR